MCSLWTGVSVIHAFWESYNQCIMQWPDFWEGWRSSWASNICTLQIVQLKEQEKCRCTDSLTGCFSLDIILRAITKNERYYFLLPVSGTSDTKISSCMFCIGIKTQKYYFIYISIRVSRTVFLLMRRLLLQDKL